MTDDADGRGGRDDADRSAPTDGGSGVLDPRAAGDDAAAEHAAVRDALAATAEDREQRVLVWRPRCQVAFGRRDEHLERYDAARTVARDAGYAATRRTAGGHAVVHDGGTVAFGVTVPVAPEAVAIEGRYCAVVDAVRDALADSGVALEQGEPDGAFCPGDHGLRADGKVVGVAQRVRRDAALVSGVVHVALSSEAVMLYERIYDHLDVAFDATAVTDLATVTGHDDGVVTPTTVAEVLRHRLDE